MSFHVLPLTLAAVLDSGESGEEAICKGTQLALANFSSASRYRGAGSEIMISESSRDEPFSESGFWGAEMHC